MASYQETTSAARNEADALARKARETADQVQDAASEQLSRLEDNIRKNPMAALGVAAGVGFLLALLARR